MSKGIRNIDGLLLTSEGRIDPRQFAKGRSTAPTEYVYDTLHKPNDKLPWHVVRTHLASGSKCRISRHSNERAALKRAEIERVGEPDRFASRKLRHKLGIDGKP